MSNFRICEIFIFFKKYSLISHFYFIKAATGGHNIENVRMLISKGADVNGSFERRGATWNLLQWIAFKSGQKDDTEIIKLLIENGADVNGALLPILINYRFEFEEVFKLTKILIGKGIDVNEADETKTTFWKPIHGAIDNFQNNYGLNDDGVEVPLHDFKTIKLLLDNGADVNSRKCKTYLTGAIITRGLYIF